MDLAFRPVGVDASCSNTSSRLGLVWNIPFTVATQKQLWTLPPYGNGYSCLGVDITHRTVKAELGNVIAKFSTVPC